MSEVVRLPLRYATGSIAAASAIAAMVWAAAFLMPFPSASMSVTPAVLAATSIAIASLFTLLLMIEAVAHERLFTDAFDPLAQRDSARLKVNQRVLLNTLEQLPLFATGIAMMVWLFPTEPAFRATCAATLVWILSRWAFWIGYHLGPLHRIAGMIGAAQSMVVLVATFAVLGWRLGGWTGATLVPGLYSLGEGVVIAALVKRR